MTIIYSYDLHGTEANKMDSYDDVPVEAFIVPENVALPQISPCKVIITKPFIYYLWTLAGTAASSSQDPSAEVNKHPECKQFGDELRQAASLLMRPDGGFKNRCFVTKEVVAALYCVPFFNGAIPH